MTLVPVLVGLLAVAPFPDLTQGANVVPKEVKLKGKVVAAARWSDKLGLNVVVLTETRRVGEASGGSKQIYGYHFVREGDGWRQLWRVADAVTDCELDLTLEFAGDLAITDLDGNGTAESTFAYVGSCSGDISADGLKVIMHEGGQKYALRGSTRVQVDERKGKPVFDGGGRTPDPAFAHAPKPFLTYAQKFFDDAGGK